jgi:hypothetical protein
VEGLGLQSWAADAAEWRGSFGYEQGHYEMSQACSGRMLFPAARGTARMTWSSPPASASAFGACNFERNPRTRPALRRSARGQGLSLDLVEDGRYEGCRSLVVDSTPALEHPNPVLARWEIGRDARGQHQAPV